MQGLIEATDYQQSKIPARKTKLFIKPIVAFNTDDLKQIRQKTKFCQVVFVDSLVVSPKTAEAWENGRYKLVRVFHRPLEIVRDDLAFLRLFQEETRS
jgi:DNA-binding transcriptional regulator YiaG